MENQLLDEGLGSGSELALNSITRDYLLQASKWGKFLAIVGFVFAGLMILGGFAFGSVFSSMSSLSPMGSMMGGIGSFIGIFYAIFGGIIIYPSLRLFQFATHARMAVDHNDTNALETAMKRLRSNLRFFGILWIIYLSLIGIMFLAGLMR